MVVPSGPGGMKEATREDMVEGMGAMEVVMEAGMEGTGAMEDLTTLPLNLTPGVDPSPPWKVL